MLKNKLIRMLIIKTCKDLKLNYPKIFRARYIFLDDSRFNLTSEFANMKFLLKNQEVYYLLFNEKISNYDEINNLIHHYTLKFIHPEFKEKIILSDNLAFITVLGKLLQTEAGQSNSTIKKFDVSDYCGVEYRWRLGKNNFKLINIKSCESIFDINNGFENKQRTQYAQYTHKKRLKI